MTTEYNEGELPLVLEALERMTNHLTAAIVSNDVNFVQNVLGNSVNGTTYCGIRARTTGINYRSGPWWFIHRMGSGSQGSAIEEYFLNLCVQ